MQQNLPWQVFFERFWNGEVMAGGYGVKNNKNSQDFLKMWANLEHGHPEGFHRWSPFALNSLV